jgi:hypothetical protein
VPTPSETFIRENVAISPNLMQISAVDPAHPINEKGE